MTASAVEASIYGEVQHVTVYMKEVSFDQVTFAGAY
jgi:hypothetical protein